MRVKHIAPLVMLTAAALVLSACSAGGEGQGAKNEDASAHSGTLTFGSWQWLEAGRGDVMWDIASGYEKVNDKAKMKQLAIPYKDFPTTMKTQIGAGSGPDIMVLVDTNFAEFAKAGVLEPLDNVLPAKQKATLNSTNEGGVFDGKQLGLTWEVVNYALMWNNKILAKAGVEAPTDMASFLSAAKAIKEKTGLPGFAARHQISEETAWWEDFSNWPYGFGGNWSEGGKLTIDRPENIAAVTAFKSMYDSGAMPIGDDASTFRTKFREGNIGMLIDNSSVALSVTAGNAALTGMDVGASALPFPSPAAARSAVYVVINKNSKNKELAKDWLKWFFSEGVQTDMAAATAPSTIGTDAPMPAEFLAANPWVKAYTAQSKFTRSPIIDDFQEKFPQISHIVMKALEKVMVNNADPAKALRDAQSEAEAVVK